MTTLKKIMTYLDVIQLTTDFARDAAVFLYNGSFCDFFPLANFTNLLKTVGLFGTGSFEIIGDS
jgi:hypothetical protein